MPPPVIGLDLGTSAVRAVQLRPAGRGPATLERLGQVMLPHGAVRDGEIVEHELVAEALRTLWSRYNLKHRKVALGLANQQVVVRTVDLPFMPDDELRASLGLQVDEYLPIPVDEAVLDYHTVERYETPEGERYVRILLVAAARDTVDSVLDAIERAKLDPVLLDLDAFAALRALVPEHVLEHREGEGELILDIGASVTNVVIHEGGVPRFVRILLMGGQQITDTLVTALGMEVEEAEERKAQTGLVDRGAQPESIDEATRIIAERATRFVGEIRGSVDYYNAQPESVPIARVILTGGGAQLPNLRDALSDALRVPVDRGHPMQEIKVGPVGLDADQLVEAEPYLTTAIGLAMGAAE